MECWKFRGYNIEERDGDIIFSDTLEKTVDTWEKRPCGYCWKHNTKEWYDWCIWELPVDIVKNACCGHWIKKDAYVQFWKWKCKRWKEAVTYINNNK